MKMQTDAVRGLKMAAVMALVASIPRIIRIDLPDLSQLVKVYLLLLLLIWTFWMVTVATESHFRKSHALVRVLILIPVWCICSAILHSVFGTDGKSGVSLFRPPDAGSVSAWQVWLIVFFRGSIFGVLVVAIVRYLNLNEERQRRELEVKQLRQSELEAQLALMQQQISPHFLFNSLSTLRSISSEPETREYILRMAQVYRYLLRKNDQHLVSLEEELAITEDYVFLMKQRFGESVVFHNEIPKNARKLRLPPLTLQILVENAIKHNVITVSKPLTIEVCVSGADKLCVRNGKQKKIMIEPGTGTGLTNIQSRYAILSGKSIEIHESDDMFEVVLPLLPPCIS